ncbi:13995_t:CDS:1, partial [Acaulospora morrowiae]
MANETYSRPFKFTTVILSPLLILFYMGIILPASLQACLAQSLFITLILPIVVQIKRPDYPYHEESALMSIIFLFYQFCLGNSIKEELVDSPILRPIQDALILDKKISHLYSTTIPNKIKQFIDFFYHKLIVGVMIGFCLGFCAVPVTLIFFFIEPQFDKAFNQFKQLTSTWAKDGEKGNLKITVSIVFSVVLLFLLRLLMFIPMILFL